MVMHDKFIVTDALSAETIQDRAMILSQVEKEIFSTWYEQIYKPIFKFFEVTTVFCNGIFR